jgi:hypothetical protein
MEVHGQFPGLAALLPGRNPGTHCNRGWVGRRASMDVFGDEKMSFNRAPSLVAVLKNYPGSSLYVP